MLFLVCLLAATAVSWAQTDVYLIPNDGTTSTLDLTDKAVGYSFKIYDASGPNANYSYYTEGKLLITIPNGMYLNICGTVKANDYDYNEGYEFFAIYDGSTVEDNLLGKYGKPSGQIVSLVGSASNMLLRFKTYGWNCYDGVEVTATIAVKDGDFVYADNAKTNLLKYVGEDEEITIPSTVTNIDGYAFFGCEDLTYNESDDLNYLGSSTNPYLFLVGPSDNTKTEYIIDANTKFIGSEAFKGCSNLVSIIVPSSVVSIGNDAFAGLKNVVYNGTAGTINDSWGATMRNGVQEGDFFLGSNGTVIGEYLGTGGAIVIPAGIQKIGAYAFKEKNITSVDFSQATELTTIGDYAFYNCDDLTTVTIPASVTTMGYRVFYECDNIPLIYCACEPNLDGWNSDWSYIPTIWDYTNWSIDENGVLSFNKDYNYDHYATYPWYALRSQIKSVKVGADVTTIGYQAFYNGYTDYENLVSVDFSEAASLNTIGSAAFYRSNLTTVTIPATLTTIESSAFRESHSLESVDFSNAEALSSIGYSAFENCIALTEADMENATGLVAINGQAFYGCYGLTTLNIPQTVTYIGYQAFQGVKNINYKGSAGSSMEKWGALARNGYVEDGLVYSDNTKTTLVAYIGDGGSVNIPAGVVTIGHLSFFNCTTLTAVSIPSSVEYIGSDAFSSCSSLSTVDMSNATNLHYIDNSAFSGCAALASISIPQSIIRVGYGAFDNCNSSLLTEQNGFYYLGNSSNPYLVLIKPVAPGNISTLTVENGVKAVAYGAFSGCTDFPITEDGASYVGSSSNAHLILARASSEEITSCTINSNTKLVAPEAFWGCYGLSYTTITIPEGIEFMGYRAFGYGGGSSPYFVTNECSQPARWDEYWNYYGGRVVWGANSYQIDGDGVLTINKNVEANDYTYYPWYSEAESITKVVFTGDVSHVGNYAFYNGNNEYYNLKQVVIPSTMKTIGDNAFQYSYYLTDINLGDATELTSIGGYAFYNCSSLETIEIPSSVTFIGEYAFNDCYNMDYNESEGISYLGNTSNPYLYMASVNSGSDEQYTINANTRFIGSYAFSGCSNMSSITIPASVKSIGNYAFTDCSNLITIDVPSTVTYIERNAFNGVGNINYNGPFGTETDTWGAKARNGSIDDNFVYADATRTTIIRYIGSDTEVTIPASVKTIGNNAFEYKDITAVDFSQATQLIQIGEYAFHNTNLTEVSIPASVETIGARAFYECYSLESIDFSNATNLATIDQYAFCNCHSLSSVAMPESVEFIGSYAFSNCISLTEVSIPASVKTLGYGAFSACVTLTDVDFSQASSLQSISDYVFNSCYNLLCSIEIPSSVSYISSYAFDGIKNIIYNGSAGDADNKFGALTRNGTFENNFVFADEAKTALTGYTCKSGSVTIPDGVKTIGAYAFDKCSDVTVTIPSALSISSIGEYAFNDIANVINYNSYETNSPWGAKKYFKSSDIDIDENGFIFTAGSERTELIGYMGSATDIVIPQTVTTIADEVFKDLSITSVDFSQATNLDEIGEYAFANCDNLTSIYIPATVTSMGYYAFADCSNLSINCEAANKPDGWHDYWNPSGRPARWLCDAWDIDENGLLTVKANVSCNWYEYPWRQYKYDYGCNIKGVTFAEGVTTIGEGAFHDAYGWGYYNDIKKVTIPSTVTTIGNDAFYSCWYISSVYFASLNSLCSIDFEDKDSNPLYNGATLYINGEETTEITIPEDVTSIGQYAFYNCDNITKVVIHDGVESVGTYAFYDCNNLIIWCEAWSQPNGWNGQWNPSDRTVIWDMNNWSLSDDGLLTVKKSFSYDNSSSYPWYYFQSDIKAVKLEAAVTEIGNYAFYDYDNLLTVDLSEATGLTSIGYRTFYSCSYLTTVDMSGATSLTTIGSEAFYESNRISRVDFASEKSLLEMQYADSYSNPLRNGANAFINDVETAEIVVPENVTAIGQYALYGCSNLTKIVVHGNVAEIGTYAIDGSSELVIWCEAESKPDGWNSSWNRNNHQVMWDYKNWTLSNSGLLTVKKNYNFDEANDYPWYGLRSQITAVAFTDAVSGIGVAEFSGYSALTSVTIPASVTSIQGDAFSYCGALETIDLSNATGLTTIASGAFYDCDALETVDMSEATSLSSIGYRAFYDCDNLETADMSGATSLATIGEDAFYSCDNLATVRIPASVTQVGNSAFENSYNITCADFGSISSLCRIAYGNSYSNPLWNGASLYINGVEMKQVTIPETVTEIKSRAFYGCDNITSVYIPATVTSVGEYVFNSCDNLTISCEAWWKPDGWNSYWNNSYRPVKWRCNDWNIDENGLLTVKTNIIYDSYYDYPWYEQNYGITGVTFTEGVTSIGQSAFYDANGWGRYSNIETVTIPSTVTEIGEYAFYNCDALQSVTIPAGVENVGDYAFYECNQLVVRTYNDVKYPNSWSSQWCENYRITFDINNWSLNDAGLLTVRKNYSYNSSGDYPWYPINDRVTGIEFAGNVTQIGSNEFYNCFRVVSVDVPDEITSIGSNAFYGVKNVNYYGPAGTITDKWGALARNGYADGDFLYADATKTNLVGYFGNGGSVTIPSTVTTISSNAFYECEGLTSVTIPASVQAIGDNAFYNCSALTTVDLNQATGLKTIGNSAFSNCNELANIDLSRATGLTSIGSTAFYNCALTSVTIPAGIEKIYSSTFSDCSNLSTVNLSNATSLKTIGSNAFYNCDALTSITIPASVEQIDSYAFGYCDNLATVNFSSATNLKRIEYCAFYECDALTSITIPASVEYIGSSAFYGCDALSSADLTSATKLSIIESSLFGNCGELTSITIPAGVESIYSTAFSYCYKLATVNFSSAANLKTIGSSAFYDCDALTSVPIPGTVTSIDSYAFQNCDELMTVTIPESVTSVGEYAFSDCPKLRFNSTGGFDYLGNTTNPYRVLVRSSNGNTDMSGLKVHDGMKVVVGGAFDDCYNWDVVENNAYYIGNSENPHLILTAATSQEINECTINRATKFIAGHAFYNCYNLTTITIPLSVESMGQGAFYDCYDLGTINCETGIQPESWYDWHYWYTEVNWAYGGWELDNDGVLTVYRDVDLPNYSYYPWRNSGNSNSIKKVVFADGVSLVGRSAFNNGWGNYNNLAEVVFPSTLKSIGSNAFYYDYNLTSVDLNSVERIDRNAFYNCYNLTSVDLRSAEYIDEYAFADVYNLTNVAIPATVQYMGEGVFQNSISDSKVLCEADEQPAGWNEYWNTNGYQVIWHYNNNVLNITSNNTTMGTVTGNGIYTYNDYAEIVATANPGYQFVRWSDGSINPDHSLNVTDHLTLEAIFASSGEIYTVSVSYDGGMGTVTGATQYVSNETATLIATPYEHYHFVEWADNHSTNPERSFTVNGSAVLEYAAVFEVDQHQLTVNSDHGQIGGDGPGTYDWGSWPSLVAIPNDGYFFVNWIDDNNNTFGGTSTSVYMSGDKEYTAVYHEIQTVNTGSTQVVASGQQVNCKFVAPMTGEYTIFSSESDNNAYGILYDAEMNQLAYDDNSYGQDNEFQIIYNLTEGETYYISAGFYYGWNFGNTTLVIKEPLVISVTAEHGTVSGAGAYSYNSTVQLSVDEVQDGWFFTKWSDGVVLNPRNITVKAAASYTAEFEQVQTVTEGENNILATRTSTDNCVFRPAVSGTYVIFSDAGGYNMYGCLLDADKNLLAENSGLDFQIQQYLQQGRKYYIGVSFQSNTIANTKLMIKDPATISVAANGDGTVSGANTYIYGTAVSVAASANAGSFFVQWNDGITNNPYSFNADEDEQFTAEFSEIQTLNVGENNVYSTFGRFAAETGVPNPNCKFVPAVSGPYAFIANHESFDTYGELYDSNMGLLTSNDNYDSNTNQFRLEYDLVEGETYYISAGFFNYAAGAGYIPLTVGAPIHIMATTDPERGTIEGAGGYAYGSNVTLTANANSGFAFVRWSDGNTDNPRTFKAREDAEYVAVFRLESQGVFNVTVTANNDSWGTVEGSSEFIEDETATISATPAAHYHFVQWNDNNIDNPRNVVVTSALTFEAEFAVDKHHMDVLGENGTTTGTGDYDWNQLVKITATPDEGHYLARWSDDSNSDASEHYVRVKSDTTITAIFEPYQYSVYLWVSEGNGTVSGDGDYAYGTDATINAVPGEGYDFKRWYCEYDGNYYTENPLTVTVKHGYTYSAQFALKTYTITVETEHGTVDGADAEYTHGQEASFTAVPETGYKFVRWDATNTANPFVTTVTSDLTLTPLFISATADIYTVTVEAGEGGTATGSGTFIANEKATISATANDGYHFVKWDDGNKEAQRELTVTATKTYKAEFALNSCVVKVVAGANGSVTGGGTFNYGGQTEITATANEGYHFVSWNDGDKNAKRTISVDGDATFTAEFAINEYTVKASATNGTVTGAGTYTHGAEATLTATAAEGYHFVKWSDGVETATRKATVTSDLSFTAEFAINTYTVKVTAANGTVTGEGTYEHGAKAKLNVTAAEGYHFVKWSDGETKATRTVVVTDNVTLTAEFEINSYTVSASATNGTVEGTGTYNYGAEATLTATASTGYRFSKWSDGVETATRKVTVKSDLSFTAEFVVNSYTISVDSAANGTITGAGTYTYGATVTLEATANAGYHFVMWTDSVMTATRTVEVTGNATFSAVFAGDNYELTVKAKNGTVEGAGTYENGTEATLTAVADAGYIFSSWDDGNTDNPRTVTVTGNKTYTATFKKALYSVTVNAENGQITGAADSLELGATVTLTAIADEGYHFVMWSDSVLDNPRTITVTTELLQTAVEGNVNFTAIFEKDDNTAIVDEAVEFVNIFAFGNTIVVENAVSDIFVYNAMGRLIERVAAEAGRTEIKINGAGIYVVKTGNTAKRVMIND